MTRTIEDRWQELLAAGEPGSREVDADSPLRMLVGVTPVGRPFFAVITAHGVGLPDLPSAIEVTRRRRTTDGRWTLTLELQVRALTDAFVSLVAELATKSAAATNEQEALSVFFETLSQWQELLAARSERLTESALRGLVAELWFGFESGGHPHSPSETTKAWVGPLGGAQDFEFLPPNLRYEVKSLRPTRTEVSISSAEQLDGDDIRLAVVTMEQIEHQTLGLTLPELVKSIRSNLDNGSDRSDFNRRLANLHLDLDDNWYAEQSYSILRLQIFEVGGEFPALRRSQLPLAITGTSYQIDLVQITPYIVSDRTYVQGSTDGDG
jgi:hypothetical protein